MTVSVLAEAVGIVDRLVRDPSQGAERIGRAFGVLRAHLIFRGCECGELVNVQGPVQVERRGRIVIGDRVQFERGMIATELVCEQDAELMIGAETGFNYGVSLRASRSIRIGKRCMIASMVHIRDEDRERVAPIVIGDDVWIAHGAMIEPGVTIGEGSVISTGSVVVTDVPAHSIAIGNPATCMPISIMRGAKR